MVKGKGSGARGNMFNGGKQPLSPVTRTARESVSVGAGSNGIPAKVEKEAKPVRERKQTEAAKVASEQSAAQAAQQQSGKGTKNKVGLDALDREEIDAVVQGMGAAIDEGIMRKVFGMQNPVVHPKFSTANECKSTQKWNVNGFGGLGFKPAKKRLVSEFESSVVRSDEVPYGGLKNLGATCYMNSILQCLFHSRPFRNGVFSLATALTDEVL